MTDPEHITLQHHINQAIKANGVMTKDVDYVVRDGEVLYSFDLTKTEDTTFDIYYKDSKNTIEIKDGKIRISAAECPDKTCVKSGWLSSSAMPVVCLPNHLVIEFANNNSEVDAVAG